MRYFDEYGQQSALATYNDELVFIWLTNDSSGAEKKVMSIKSKVEFEKDLDDELAAPLLQLRDEDDEDGFGLGLPSMLNEAQRMGRVNYSTSLNGFGQFSLLYLASAALHICLFDY